MRRAFSLIELLVVIVIIAILVGCLLGPGGFDALIALIIGWIRYPLRLAQERDVDWAAVLTCGVCLVGLTIGVHGFGWWFAASRPAPSQWPWSRTLKLMGLVMLMFFAGIGVTHEIVWMATTKERLTGDRSAARMQNLNNLKQIALAAHQHADTHKELPAGAIFDAHGRALHGWQTALLPYLDKQNLYKEIDLTLHWNHPKNVPAMKQEIYEFVSPFIGVQSPREGFAPSHYAGNVHVVGAKSMKIDEITDGRSNTLLFGEVAHDIKPWGMPMNCRDPAVGLNVPHGFANPRGNDVTFALADGSVRTIRADVSPAVLKAIATPRGGDTETMPD